MKETSRKNTPSAASSAAKQVPEHYTTTCPHGPRIPAPGRVCREADFTSRNLPGIFRFCDWLPIHRTLPIEAGPVCYRSEALARELGIPDLFIDFNGYWPERGGAITTCSFKELEAIPTMIRVQEQDPANPGHRIGREYRPGIPAGLGPDRNSGGGRGPGKGPFPALDNRTCRQGLRHCGAGRLYRCHPFQPGGLRNPAVPRGGRGKERGASGRDGNSHARCSGHCRANAGLLLPGYRQRHGWDRCMGSSAPSSRRRPVRLPASRPSTSARTSRSSRWSRHGRTGGGTLSPTRICRMHPAQYPGCIPMS